MAKVDKFEFEGFLVHKDLETQVREAGENHQRELAAARERMADPTTASKEQAAYDAALPDLLALSPSEVCWPESDPGVVLHEVFHYVDEVAKRRRKLQARVAHKLNVNLMLSLERYAWTTIHAFKVHRDAPPPPGSLAQLVQEGAKRRYRLMLACHLAFDQEPQRYGLLKNINGSTVPEAIAYDIFLLRRTLLEGGPKTGGPWYANHRDLAHSEHLASTLLQAATNPALSAALAWPATDMYARAFTLVHRACYEAELGLVELYNSEDPEEPDAPHCVFCERAPRLQSVHKVFGTW